MASVIKTGMDARQQAAEGGARQEPRVGGRAAKIRAYPLCAALPAFVLKACFASLLCLF
jgi:hypothetical protein